MRHLSALLASAAILVAAPAFANEAAADSQAPTAAPVADGAANAEDAIVVYGSGQTRQVQEIKGAELGLLAVR